MKYSNIQHNGNIIICIYGGAPHHHQVRISAAAWTLPTHPDFTSCRQPQQTPSQHSSSSVSFTRHCSQHCCSNLSLATQRGKQPASQLATSPSPAVLQQLMLKPCQSPKCCTHGQHFPDEAIRPQLIPTPSLFPLSAVSANKGMLLDSYSEFKIQLQKIQSTQSTDLSLVYSLYCPSACT